MLETMKGKFIKFIKFLRKKFIKPASTFPQVELLINILMR
jgi:hypothetical protein